MVKYRRHIDRVRTRVLAFLNIFIYAYILRRIILSCINTKFNSFFENNERVYPVSTITDGSRNIKSF